jgi:transcriptional regulator with XRE-family HTH domain
VSDELAYIVGSAIRAERSRQRLSQSALAAKLGWSRQAVTYLEAGQRGLYLHDAPAVCRALNVTLAELLAKADEADRSALGI